MFVIFINGIWHNCNPINPSAHKLQLQDLTSTSPGVAAVSQARKVIKNQHGSSLLFPPDASASLPASPTSSQSSVFAINLISMTEHLPGVGEWGDERTAAVDRLDSV